MTTIFSIETTKNHKAGMSKRKDMFENEFR
jgi:hypothetical protein